MTRCLSVSLMIACGSTASAPPEPVPPQTQQAPPADAPAPQAPQTEIVPVDAVFSGTYTVPVTDPGLEVAASFAVADIHWRASNGASRLTYTLPEALLGKAIRLDFAGGWDGGKGVLTSSDGQLTCRRQGSQIQCDEDISSLMPLEVRMDVVSRLALPGLSEARQRVANIFAHEPLGVLTFSLE